MFVSQYICSTVINLVIDSLCRMAALCLRSRQGAALAGRRPVRHRGASLLPILLKGLPVQCCCRRVSLVSRTAQSLQGSGAAQPLGVAHWGDIGSIAHECLSLCLLPLERQDEGKPHNRLVRRRVWGYTHHRDSRTWGGREPREAGGQISTDAQDLRAAALAAFQAAVAALEAQLGSASWAVYLVLPSILSLHLDTWQP